MTTEARTESPKQDALVVLYLLRRLNAATDPREAFKWIVELALRNLAWHEPTEGKGFTIDDYKHLHEQSMTSRIITAMCIARVKLVRGADYEHQLLLRVYRPDNGGQDPWSIEFSNHANNRKKKIAVVDRDSLSALGVAFYAAMSDAIN
jgi:hypothetical protein